MRDAYRRRCRDRASSPGCDCDVDDDDGGGDDVGRGEGTVSVADANLSTGYPPDLPDNGVENRIHTAARPQVWKRGARALGYASTFSRES